MARPMILCAHRIVIGPLRARRRILAAVPRPGAASLGLWQAAFDLGSLLYDLRLESKHALVAPVVDV
jgi:hypothetical protein